MKKRTWAAAGSAALLLATAASVGLTGGSASAGTPAPVGTPQLVSSTLTWKTSGTSTTVTYSAAKSTQTPQTLLGTNCVFSSGGTQYLGFTVSGPKIGNKDAGAGFKSNTLGVRSGNDSNGTSCQQVNSNVAESLTIKVDPTTTTGLFGPGRFVSAKIDLNLSSNTLIQTEMWQGVPGAVGSVLVGRSELQSGLSGPQAPTENAAQLQVCSTKVNSGSQNAYANNCLLSIAPLTVASGGDYIVPPLPDTPYYTSGGGYVGPKSSPTGDDLSYDYIKMTPTSGDFGIQGGNAWPSNLEGSKGTIFTLGALSDGQINCFDGSNLSQSQAAPIDAPGAVLTRLKLGDKDATCKLKPYDLAYDASTDTITYHQALTDGQLTSQYALKLPRDYATGVRPNASVPAVKVDWEDGTAAVTLKYCPAGLVTTTTGSEATYYVPTAYNYGVLNSALVANGGDDQSSASAGIQFACVYLQTVTVNGPDGKVLVNDYIYFAGDARFAP